MYCKNCGKLISDNSLFCSFCGSKQSNDKVLQEGEKKVELQENKILIFVDKNKSFVVFFLIWFFFHLIFICISSRDEHRGLWPFGNLNLENDYNFTEFSFYLIVPIVIFGLWKLVGDEIKENLDKS